MTKPKKDKQKSRVRRRIVFAGMFTIPLIILMITALYLDVFDIFERKLVDFRFNYMNQGQPASQEIVYIDIDEMSLQTLSPSIGGWPWPRGGIVAQHIIEYVMLGEPSIFLFDILYVDYSPKAPDVDIPEEDLWLLDVSMYYQNVSHAVHFSTDAVGDARQMPESAEYNFEIQVDDSASEIENEEFNNFVMPYDPLGAYAGMLHTVNHTEDADGISRESKLFVEYQGKYYPSLSLRALQTKLGTSTYRIEGRTFIMLDDTGNEVRRIPMTGTGHFRINFQEDNNEFIAYPADNIIASSMNQLSGEGDLLVPYEEFKDKIVIIGASATGLKDIKVTPMGDNIAGPYLHITTISNILQEQYLRSIPKWITSLIIAFSVLVILTPTLFIRNWIKNIVGVVLILGYLALALLVFKQSGLVLDMSTTLIAMLLSYFTTLIYVSLSEAAEKNKISSAMGKYLAPSVMTEVLEKYDELVGEVGEGKEIAILFSDIRSFTSISETLPADRVVYLLNMYLAEMIKVVFENRGTLDKMIGDAVMAFWGAPNAEERKDYLAVKTGLEMISRLEAVNSALEAENMPRIRIGVGVNTGDMIVGNIGSEQRLDYTVIGDNVNLGSRMEGLTKYYLTPVLVSETTYELTKDDFVYMFADTVAVKGKEKGIGIYLPLAERNGADISAIESEVTSFNAARELYTSQRFDEALPAFEEIENSESVLNGIAGVFSKRCKTFIKRKPPANWNGIWKMVDK